MRAFRLAAIAAISAAMVLGASPVSATGELEQVTDFGSNPGNTLMYQYEPSNFTSNRPLVVVLHGCTQSAADMDTETGWVKWAEQDRFALLFPQQQSSNNGNKCWNFFENSDNRRGFGEALSIKQQIDWMIQNHNIDTRRIYVTGLSAGAAMTNVMLATYPDVFAAGAPIAGVAFKCATNAVASLLCNAGVVNAQPKVWGGVVRGATTWNGPWPKVSIWHGNQDLTVNIANLNETMEQWTNVHGIDQTADVTDTIAGHTYKAYTDGSGTRLVETFYLKGFGHATPVDPGTGARQCGTAVGYNKDGNICSSDYIAKWFGLH